jgi:pimeloyl-ACP methyl ester carboxylesterase
LWSYRVGAGAPAVCVHGIGVTSTYFRPLAHELARSRLVLVPDLPGWGRSPRPRETLDMRGLALALLAFLDGEGLERVPLVANSMGCQVAVELAIAAPERVSALVLVGPTVDPYSRPLARFVPAFLRDALREPLSLDLLIVHDYLWMGLRRFMRTARRAWLHRIEERLPLVHVPSIVVRGKRDAFVSQRWCEEAAALLPGARLAVCDGAHAVHYSAPREVAGVVLGFLEECEDRGGEG